MRQVECGFDGGRTGQAQQGPAALLIRRKDVAADAAFPNALLDSPASGRAVPLVAARLAASAATVLLAATASMVARLGGSDEVLPVEFPPRPSVSLALDAVDLPGSLGLTMTADPSRLPRAEMERLLYGVEELVVTEALRLRGHG